MSENDSDEYFDPELFVDRSYQPNFISIQNITLNMNALFSASSTDHDLTGQVVWPASYFLATFLIENQHLLMPDDVNILELGAGAGLVGLTAAKLIGSPSRVTITDGNPIVMDLLKENIDSNFSQEKPDAYCLEWNSDLPHCILKKKFNLILGSDVIFWPDQIQPLFNCLFALLQNQRDAAAYICYTERCKSTTESMLRVAHRRFHVTVCPVHAAVYASIADKQKQPLAIYKFTEKFGNE